MKAYTDEIRAHNLRCCLGKVKGNNKWIDIGQKQNKTNNKKQTTKNQQTSKTKETSVDRTYRTEASRIMCDIRIVIARKYGQHTY